MKVNRKLVISYSWCLLFAISAGCINAQEMNCTDGIDNDSDSLIDCLDPDCSCSPGPPFALDTLGDGGFENGSTLADNNWMEDGNAGTNQWEVGTAPTNIPLGNCAYISDDGGVSHNYSLFSSTDTRIYHEVDLSVFAASDVIELSFDYKAWMDDGTWDVLNVRVGTGCPQTPCDYVIQNLHNQTDWIRESVDISSYYPDVVQIEFYFESGTCCGSNPPAAIDNVMVYKLTADELLSEKEVSLSANNLDTETLIIWSIDQSYDVEEIILERAIGEGPFREHGCYTDRNQYDYSTLISNPGIVEFYRLKVAETSGNSWYSETIRVKKHSDERVALYPSPVESTLYYELQDFYFQEIIIFDAAGRKVHREMNLRGTEGNILLTDLEPGIYNIVFRNESDWLSKKILLIK